ncbi:tyrosine-type recombinase/integrase [Amycolatopsis orientalis]|uniref:tyrosine-type recombinase/integrase n=1 Tax=Amycolatopsis orientalis TaxID=31958 RepID=UPI00042665C4|nr:tyrosine-type recombinase/integrase [Amycolatopsis orientalis]
MPQPGEEHSPRGLSLLWLARHYDDSPNTAEAYYRGLLSWLDYCQLTSVNPLRARTPDVDSWTLGLKLDGASASVINQRMAAIRGWYTYLRRGRVEITDPVTDAQRPAQTKTDESDTPFLTIAEIGTLLRQAMREVEAAGDNLAKRELALRLAALVWLLAATGIRSGAVFAAAAGGLHHNGGHRRLRYHLKGHSRDVSDPIPPQVAIVLDAYLDCRAARQTLAALPPEEPLLATSSGKHWTKQGATMALAGLARRAGLPNADDLNLHALRHTAASGALNELGITLDRVRRMLRHRSITTTQIYVHDGLQPGQSAAHKLAAAYGAEIHMPGSGTLGGAVQSGAAAVTRAAITAHSHVTALHRIADTGDSLPATVVAEIAATLSALLDRCDGADPVYAPLAETIRALIAGGLPSLTGAGPDAEPS